MSIISLKGADIYQRENLILSNVNITIESGEFVYIIGKVGSGKSSLLKTLYAELPLHKGEGKIGTFELHKIKDKEIPYLRRKVGIIFQDFQLLYDRTVEKNLEFVLQATGWKQDTLIEKRIKETLELVGMQKMRKKMPHQLSGGEQQRIVIARALLNNPNILIADEPTGNLDPETSDELLQLFLKIKEQGKTIVMVTHNHNLLSKFPSRTLICEQGLLKESKQNAEEIDFEDLMSQA